MYYYRCPIETMWVQIRFVRFMQLLLKILLQMFYCNFFIMTDLFIIFSYYHHQIKTTFGINQINEICYYVPFMKDVRSKGGKGGGEPMLSGLQNILLFGCYYRGGGSKSHFLIGRLWWMTPYITINVIYTITIKCDSINNIVRYNRPTRASMEKWR